MKFVLKHVDGLLVLRSLVMKDLKIHWFQRHEFLLSLLHLETNHVILGFEEMELG